MLYFDDIVLHARERPHGQARFAETISSMYYALLTDFKLQCLIANTTDSGEGTDTARLLEVQL